jgi:hypothetical protein
MSAPVATLNVYSPVIPGSPAKAAATACPIPDALQQFLDQLEGWALENQRNVRLPVAESLRNLKEATERKWQIAAYAGYTSSATLAEILEGGWKEWKEING